MIAYCSVSAGVLVPDLPTVKTSDLVFLCDDAITNASQTRHILSLVDDWESVEGSDSSDLVSKFKDMFWIDRAASYAVVLIDGTASDLEYEILEYIEESLQTRITLESLVDRLIVAPLVCPDRAATLALTALSNGFAAAALLFETVDDAQPLLRRLVNHWLGMQADYRTDAGVRRSDVWNLACSSGAVRKSLAATSRSSFERRWNALALEEAVFPTPASRIAFARFASNLATRVFPGEDNASDELAATPHDEYEEEHQKNDTPPHVSFKRALKQIDAITAAVAAADDTKADRFLRDLITQQRRFAGGDEFAVKSLCNIAQRCADLFRTDFERSCLDRAREILPTDAWTLCQFADHLKRVGEFEASLETYKSAASFGYEQLSMSGMADVWSERGEYAKAIELYKQIPSWNEEPTLRTAIADNLRRMGRYSDAERDYRDIIATEVGIDFSRARAGCGDIARRRGDLTEARKIYESLSNCGDVRARRVYRITLCDLLMQMGHLDDAMEVADKLVRDAPFFLQARIKRGSIMGMLNREREALEDIPTGGVPRAFGEWMRAYCRGLLLFKLGRYAEAKAELTEHLNVAVDRGDNRAIIRLGAAFAYLHANDLEHAQRELSNIESIGDHFANHLLDVLKLHLAVARQDQRAIEQHAKRLDDVVPFHPMIADAAANLLNGNFSGALALEANLLLAVSPELTTAA